eukprot:7290080-Pyramimonas_sp.AAC.1
MPHFPPWSDQGGNAQISGRRWFRALPVPATPSLPFGDGCTPPLLPGPAVGGGGSLGRPRRSKIEPA